MLLLHICLGSVFYFSHNESQTLYLGDWQTGFFFGLFTF